MSKTRSPRSFGRIFSECDDLLGKALTVAGAGIQDGASVVEESPCLGGVLCVCFVDSRKEIFGITPFLASLSSTRHSGPRKTRHRFQRYSRKGGDNQSNEYGRPERRGEVPSTQSNQVTCEHLKRIRK